MAAVRDRGRFPRRATLLAIFLALLAAVTPFLGIPGWTIALATIVCFTSLSLLGLNLIFGVAGMLAFGQAAMMSLPAYVGGMLAGAGVAVPLALAGGLVAGLAAARLVALIFVRLPGVFLAVGTLGLGFVLEGLARAFPATTGGASGLVLLAGRAIGARAWYGVALFTLLLGVFTYRRLVGGAAGRRLRAVRHDELMAASIGIDVARAKAAAFTWGSGFAVVAGLLLGFYVGVVVPEDAGVQRSLEQIGMVMLGGPGRLLGPLIGATTVNWLFFATGWSERFEPLIYGAVFLAAVLYARHGLAGWLERCWRAIARRLEGDVAVAHAPAEAAAGVAPRPARRAGPCLEIIDIGKSFGGVRALEGVSFSVASGEIFALVGPNGAGKSTLFNLIGGLVAPSVGRVLLDGQSIGAWAVHRRAALVGRSFQVARLVPELTVVENIALRIDQLAGAPAGEAARLAAARAWLAGFGLAALADRPVGVLSAGQQKLIDVVRAATSAPRLVLLDEPAVGLDGDELRQLSALLTCLRDAGSAVVIVEHNIAFVAEIATRGLVLDCGRPIALGTMAEILDDPAVRAAYFGAL